MSSSIFYGTVIKIKCHLNHLWNGKCRFDRKRFTLSLTGFSLLYAYRMSRCLGRSSLFQLYLIDSMLSWNINYNHIFTEYALNLKWMRAFMWIFISITIYFCIIDLCVAFPSMFICFHKHFYRIIKCHSHFGFANAIDEQKNCFCVTYLQFSMRLVYLTNQFINIHGYTFSSRMWKACVYEWVSAVANTRMQPYSDILKKTVLNKR